MREEKKNNNNNIINRLWTDVDFYQNRTMAIARSDTLVTTIVSKRADRRNSLTRTLFFVIIYTYICFARFNSPVEGSADASKLRTRRFEFSPINVFR